MQARETAWLDDSQVANFKAQGAIHIKGLFGDWLEPLARGIARNEREPSKFGGNSITEPGAGRFFDDYCNWRRIPEYRDFVEASPAAAIVAQATGSRRVRIFHEHLLIKEPGTSKRTPWHQDQPYYNVHGKQTASLWLSLDPVSRDCCPEFIAGSHAWGRLYYPRLFKSDTNYDYSGPGYETVPDIEADRGAYDILSWDLEPGDALLFSYMTLHGAQPNLSATRRRGFSTRWLGDDATYAVRPGVTSPPYHDIGLADGDPLPEDLFPVVFSR